MISDKELSKKEFSDFFLEPATSEDVSLFTDKLGIIADAISRFNARLNNTHIFHPDNLFLLWDKWNSSWPDKRFPRLHESKMLQQIGIALGKYFVDTLGATWCYAVCDDDIALPAIRFSTMSAETYFIPELALKKGIIAGESLTQSIKAFTDIIAEIDTKLTSENFDQFVSWARKNESEYNFHKIWEYFFSLKNVVLLSLCNKQDLFATESINGKNWLSVFTSKEHAKEQAEKIGAESIEKVLTMKQFLTLIFLNENTNIVGITVDAGKGKDFGFDAQLYKLRLLAKEFLPDFMSRTEEKIKSKLLKLKTPKETTKPEDEAEDEKFWRDFFEAENIIFISKIKPNPEPFIGIVNERPCLFAFTSGEAAMQFAAMPSNKKDFVTTNGDISSIAVKTQDALLFINDLSSMGVLDFCVNAPKGLVAPIADLPFLVRGFNGD